MRREQCGQSGSHTSFTRRRLPAPFQCEMLLAGALAAGLGLAAFAADRKLPSPPAALAPVFQPPAEYANDFGSYRSPLTFEDGRRVKTAAEWKERRAEILRIWRSEMGEWPPLIERPKIEDLERTRRDNFTQRKIRLEIAPKRTTDGYLLVPDGKGPFPAALVVYYDPEAGVGQGKELRDFAYQLAKRGFVTLSIGSPYESNYPTAEGPPLQPLSYLAYMAANCGNALASLPEVEGRRIGIVGHSYGGKWAMFASCLHERFAAAAWSDGGVVFDESRSNVNYWEPWYLGFDRNIKRNRGIPSDTNPRTGAYKRLVASRRDLHELHALMAPRPFLVSGGSEDPPERWKALNHSVAVNAMLGQRNRVAFTSRPTHDPTPESNEQIYRFFEWALR
ncbi:MAG: dienelactone hydrolase family protein [Actinomycetota bacterium]